MGAAAPLVSIAQAPAPAGASAQWFYGADGARLRAALFTPPETSPGRPRGSVVLSPGRTEPLEKYFEVVGELQARGFVVLVHDWRGHGLSQRFLSDPQRGHARGWRRFLADFDALLTTYERRLPRPWLALGHSMGAALNLLAFTEGEGRFAAALLSAPMLGVRTAGRSERTVHRWACLMGFSGRAGRYVYPLARAHAQRFEDNVLTHDRTRWARWQAQLQACPALMLGGVTWGWLVFALAVTHRLQRLKGVERVAIPLTFVAAGEDKLCVNAASQAIAARAPQGRYVEVPGAFHEILMETDERRALLWAEFDALADRIAPRG